MKRLFAGPTPSYYHDVSELSKTGYIQAISFATLLMSGVMATGIWASHTWPMTFGLIMITFVVSIAAIFVFNGSNSLPLTMAGVGVMSFAMGLMVGPVTAYYKKAVIEQAFALTVAIVVGMSVLGIVLPWVFNGLGRYLMAALVFLIVARFAQIIFLTLGFQQAAHVPALAWISVFVFALLVAYDWSSFLTWDFTWNNAFKASGALVLDAINLFLNLLQILGGDDD